MPREEQTQDDVQTKRLPFKLLVLIGSLMLVEAGVIVGVAVITNTPQVEAQPFATDPTAELDRIVEIPVVEERFQNTKQGVAYLYDTQITLQVKKRHESDVTAIIESNQARIRMEIASLWRNAEPRHFEEPHLSTLTRQAEKILDEIIGPDAATGESRVAGVLIPKLNGFRADF